MAIINNKAGGLLWVPVVACLFWCLFVFTIAFFITGSALMGVWATSSNPSKTDPRFGVAIALLGAGFLMFVCWGCWGCAELISYLNYQPKRIIIPVPDPNRAFKTQEPQKVFVI
jgi:hypothetical protein